MNDPGLDAALRKRVWIKGAERAVSLQQDQA